MSLLWQILVCQDRLYAIASDCFPFIRELAQLSPQDFLD